MSWDRLAFGDAFDLVSDRGIRVPQKNYAHRGPVPVVDQGEGLIGGYTDRTDAVVRASLPVIVFGDHTRRVKFVDFPFAVGAQGTKLLRARSVLLPRYAYHYLSSVRLEDRGYGRHFALLRRITIPTPSLAEQRRVVDILEDHLSRLDAADADLHRALSRSDALLLAALRGHVESSRSTGVSFGRIGEFAETNLGKMLDAKKTTGEPTPYLANINVRWGRFDLEDLKLVALTAEERNRLTMLPGDLMVCEGGEPGRCAVWDRGDSGMAYQKALHRVRVHDSQQLEPEYLALMLRETIQSGRADRLFTGTTIKHLPQEKLRLIEVPIPEHSVQVAALDDFARVADSSESLNAALQAAKSRNATLRRAVLAAAFSGKLTDRRTDVEVIEEMAEAGA